MKSESLLGERDRLLGVRSVAEHLMVSQGTVYRWCREGIMPCLKIGGSVRIRQSAVEDFLERSERSKLGVIERLSAQKPTGRSTGGAFQGKSAEAA